MRSAFGRDNGLDGSMDLKWLDLKPHTELHRVSHPVM